MNRSHEYESAVAQWLLAARGPRAESRRQTGRAAPPARRRAGVAPPKAGAVEKIGAGVPQAGGRSVNVLRRRGAGADCSAAAQLLA